jgi:hypothetical protein
MSTKSRKFILTILISIFWASMQLRAGIAVLNGLTHEMKLSPGEKVRGRIELQNISEKETSVRLFQTDYWFSHTGDTKYNDPGSSARSNARWISLAQSFITLQANEIRSVEFEVVVPSADSLTGTYWSVILLEAINPPDTTDQKGMNINTVMRYAVQVISHIGETGTRDLQFLNVTLRKGNPGAVLDVDMENRGERALRPEIGIELFNDEGVSRGIFKTDRRRIYPGTSARFSIAIGGVLPGKYSGVLVADCDEDHIFGTNLTLEL